MEKRVCQSMLSRLLFCVRQDAILEQVGSSLPGVVCRRAHVLFTLFVLVCIQWCPTHIMLCFYFVVLRLVYPILPVSLYFHYLIAPSVFSNVYLTPQLLIKVLVPSEEQSCMCVLGISILSLFTTFLLRFWICSDSVVFFVFHFILYCITILCSISNEKRNTTLSEQFRNQITKPYKQLKSIALTQKSIADHFPDLK